MHTNRSFILGGALAVAALAHTASTAHAEVNQPQEIIMRPLTTPGSQITVGGELGILIAPDPIGTSMSLALGGRYGVDDRIEVGAVYGFSLKEFEAKGALGVEAAYRIMDGNLAVAADVATGYDLFAEGISPLQLGARVRFRVNDQISIQSGGGQLSIALDGEVKPITLGVPVGVGFQASPQIHAFVDTELMRLSISDSETVVFGADYIPLRAGAFFSPSNTLDVGASIGWLDLKEASDTIAILATASLHM